MIRILALDGGGIRGVIPCTILHEIEKRTGKMIVDMFDLIAGTSTGGIIGIGLNVENPQTPGKTYTAEKIGDLYVKEGGRIFKKKSGFSTGFGMLEESYDYVELEAVLLEYFGDATLKNSKTELLVTSYDIEARRPFYFLSRLARANPAFDDFLMRQMARSTSAAPTYFEPNRIERPAMDPLSLIDGGVFANNPAMLAYTEAINIHKLRNGGVSSKLETFDAVPVLGNEAPEFFMLSLGTGRVVTPYPYDDARNWGAAGWIRPLIEIMMQGVSETVHYQMQYVLAPKLNGPQQYFRFDPVIPEKGSDMANVEADNIEQLQAIARKCIQDNEAAFDTICTYLTK